MLTSHTSSEEEKILHLRKFAQNIKKNNEGPQLLEDTPDQNTLTKAPLLGLAKFIYSVFSNLESCLVHDRDLSCLEEPP